MKRLITFTLFLIIPFFIWAQAPKKSLGALRIQTPVKVDGKLDDPAWMEAAIAADFVESNPNPGVPAAQRSEVQLAYDDVHVYIAAKLYDDRDSVLRQLCLRDAGRGRMRSLFSNTNTDWFAVAFDHYQNGINGVVFAVSAAGVQLDSKLNSGNRDLNWDAVWNSKVSLEDDHWVVEMAIPFSALRFPNAAEQDWAVNFGRGVRRSRAEHWWNFIDPGVEGFLNQFGTLEGLRDIESPVRLQATPYVAAILSHYHDKSAEPVNQFGRTFTGGMDIKYGINDAFTLDMTLIPNFGEAAQDNQVLNLSPFEIRFDENRPFFTEGTELFNIGNLFYSRRIGGTPLKRYDIYNDYAEEDVLSNPSESQLYNALKLSGRTEGGLGIGAFNAVEGRMYATVRGDDGVEAQVETNPITNYNVMVFDQNLPNNSSVSLVNANTLRFGEDYDANASAFVFNANNKKRSFNASGSAKLSQILHANEANELGYAYNLNLAKTGGKFTYGAFYNEESDTYNPNDLGFLFNNNERSFGARFSYNQYEPFGGFNGMGVNVRFNYGMLQNPSLYTQTSVNFNHYYIRKSFFSFGNWIEIAPKPGHDYFETREAGFDKYLATPGYGATGLWISTDYRKKVALDAGVRGGWDAHFNWKGQMYGWEFQPRFRVNDRLFFIWTTEQEFQLNFLGYAFTDPDGNPLMGVRDVVSLENTLDANYIFNNLMGVTLRARHYWTKVNYDSYHEINAADGLLLPAISPIPGDDPTPGDQSFNAFTIDLVYTWRFAPGSDLVFVWKNAIFNSDTEATDINYFQNWKLFGDAPQNNSFTIKAVYFLDYYTIKNQLKNRKGREL